MKVRFINNKDLESTLLFSDWDKKKLDSFILEDEDNRVSILENDFGKVVALFCYSVKDKINIYHIKYEQNEKKFDFFLETFKLLNKKMVINVSNKDLHLQLFLKNNKFHGKSDGENIVFSN